MSNNKALKDALIAAVDRLNESSRVMQGYARAMADDGNETQSNAILRHAERNFLTIDKIDRSLLHLARLESAQ